ncbi:hypothetical protein F4678DRAFT_465948 [Xylaria arbuscula]|nr:hypothetical protein F4678DRAFT_465948 [Xylaria arbuscula]
MQQQQVQDISHPNPPFVAVFLSPTAVERLTHVALAQSRFTFAFLCKIREGDIAQNYRYTLSPRSNTHSGASETTALSPFIPVVIVAVVVVVIIIHTHTSSIIARLIDTG